MGRAYRSTPITCYDPMEFNQGETDGNNASVKNVMLEEMAYTKAELYDIITSASGYQFTMDFAVQGY